MTKGIRLVLTVLIALAASVGFNYFLLELSERSLTDQVILVVFLTLSLSYVLFSIWEGQGAHLPAWKSDAAPKKFTLRELMPGILLAVFFFGIYLYYGLQLSITKVGLIDNLFDADIPSWQRRIAGADVFDFEMRGPHPYTYFIVRPFGLFLNLITGNSLLSATLLNTIAGGAGVYLTWLFVKHRFENDIYALLIAILFGISTSHAFFSAVVETYIFSAFSLILFLYLLESRKGGMAALIAAGALTFGITMTNFVQNALAFLVMRPRWREVYRFLAWTVSVSLILSYLHAAAYPASKLFLLSSSRDNEEKFFQEAIESDDWKISGRILLLERTMVLYTVIAPSVFALDDEVGATIPQFSFYRVTPGTLAQSKYDGIADILVPIWMLMLLVSAGVILWKMIQTRRVDMPLALVLCLTFNFALHLIYGKEPFLYSPNWAYALILLIAYGLEPFSRNKFFQAGFLIFLALLAYNQWQFFAFVLDALGPFLGAPT